MFKQRVQGDVSRGSQVDNYRSPYLLYFYKYCLGWMLGRENNYSYIPTIDYL